MTTETRLTKKMKDMSSKLSFATDDEVKAWELNRKMIAESVAEVKKHIAESVKPEQRMFSFIPTPLARTSPFFIMNRKQMANRSTDEIVFVNSWGKLVIGGRRLCVYDETVLFVLLSLAVKNNSSTFKTTCYQVCKLSGLKNTASAYKSIRNSIKNLNTTYFEMEVSKNKKLVSEPFGHIFDGGEINTKAGKILITFSQYFLNMYASGFVTNIDFKFRAGLKGDTSKCLYRFYVSQRKNKFNCGLFKLCEAINLGVNRSDPNSVRKMRYLIRVGLKELKSRGFLVDWSIKKNGQVFIEKKGK